MRRERVSRFFFLFPCSYVWLGEANNNFCSSPLASFLHIYIHIYTYSVFFLIIEQLSNCSFFFLKKKFLYTFERVHTRECWSRREKTTTYGERSVILLSAWLVWLSACVFFFFLLSFFAAFVYKTSTKIFSLLSSRLMWNFSFFLCSIIDFYYKIRFGFCLSIFNVYLITKSKFLFRIHSFILWPPIYRQQQWEMIMMIGK